MTYAEQIAIEIFAKKPGDQVYLNEGVDGEIYEVLGTVTAYDYETRMVTVSWHNGLPSDIFDSASHPVTCRHTSQLEVLD